MRRHRGAAVGIATAAVLLAGCTVPLPDVKPEPESAEAYPVLDEGRLDRVLGHLDTALAEADSENDPDALPPRITERAETARAAEYRLVDATDDDDDPYELQSLSTDEAAVIAAATEDWPRTVMVVTDPPEEANAARLLVLRQDEARDDYSLVGWVRLLPGVTTPETNSFDTGVAPVDPDSEDLVLEPSEVAGAYADLLDDGDDSEYADQFADDPYRELLTEEMTSLNDSLDVAGKVTQKTSGQEEVDALTTADGGAIVFGGMTSKQKYEHTVDRSTMNVGSLFAALNDGEAEVDNEITGTYAHMIVFYVPPADDEDAEVTVLGAERVLTEVTAE